MRVTQLRLAIDASRNRSGGAQAHLIGILSSLIPERHDISEVHVWAFRALHDRLPDRPWLVRHCPAELEGSLARQLAWQAFRLGREVERTGCNILFATDASTLCRFRPLVVLSQDLLSYEPGVMQSFEWGLARLRLKAILHVQNAAFRRSEGVIFLTNYASTLIQGCTGPLGNAVVIPHGVGDAFRTVGRNAESPAGSKGPVRCLYVSPISRYKHQWEVVRAIGELRRQGLDVRLELVGAYDETGRARLDGQLAESDPHGRFVTLRGPVDQVSLPGILSEADVFVFASSCENLPITLLEAMAAGLPIACSNRGPMPEVARDAACYFDPENPVSIAGAISSIVRDSALRAEISTRAREVAAQYRWDRCAESTFAFIAEVWRSWRVSA